MPATIPGTRKARFLALLADGETVVSAAEALAMPLAEAFAIVDEVTDEAAVNKETPANARAEAGLDPGSFN